MSRKKVKKEVVKRKTSIYDPMGIYGRGLTENQKLGMINQLKVGNITESEPVITRQILDKYRNILIQYGIPTLLPVGNNIETRILEFTMNSNELEISNDDIISALKIQGIVPRSFVCDSFAIIKPENTAWTIGMKYFIKVGNSRLGIGMLPDIYTFDPNDMTVIPGYWMNMDSIHYFVMHFDINHTGAIIRPHIRDLSDQEQFWDFLSLPNDGTEVPYLLYPNPKLPELRFGLSDDFPRYGYKLRVRITMIY